MYFLFLQRFDTQKLLTSPKNSFLVFHLPAILLVSLNNTWIGCLVLVIYSHWPGYRLDLEQKNIAISK